MLQIERRSALPPGSTDESRVSCVRREKRSSRRATRDIRGVSGSPQNANSRNRVPNGNGRASSEGTRVFRECAAERRKNGRCAGAVSKEKKHPESHKPMGAHAISGKPTNPTRAGFQARWVQFKTSDNICHVKWKLDMRVGLALSSRADLVPSPSRVFCRRWPVLRRFGSCGIGGHCGGAGIAPFLEGLSIPAWSWASGAGSMAGPGPASVLYGGSLLNAVAFLIFSRWTLPFFFLADSIGVLRLHSSDAC